MICLIRVLFIFGEEKQTMMLLNKTSTCSFLKDQHSPRRNLFDELVRSDFSRAQQARMDVVDEKATVGTKSKLPTREMIKPQSVR